MLQKNCAKTVFLLALCAVAILLKDDYFVSGAGLPGRFKAEKVEFHWGQSNGSAGSEHSINGKRFPVEVSGKTCACVVGGGEKKIRMYCCSLRWLWNRAVFPSVNISLSRPFRPSQHSIYHLLCAFAMSALSSALLALPALTSHGLTCKQPLFWFLP